MSIAVAQDIKITYGGFEVGKDTDRLIVDKIEVDRGYTSSVVRFNLIVAKETQDDFESEIALVEAAFRTPRQDLTVLVNGKTWVSFLHDSSSGFDSEPRIRLMRDKVSTEFSRKYEVTIQVTEPADLSGQSGRRDSRVELRFSPSRRRTLTVTGSYTAIGGTSAFDQYTANITAYISSLQSGFGGVWERIEENVTHNDSNKTVDFVHISRELLFDQITSTTDDPEIVRDSIIITRAKTAPGDTEPSSTAIGEIEPSQFIPSNSDTVRRLIQVRIAYEAWIDADETTDLISKWEDIRLYLIQAALNFANAVEGAVTEEVPSFDAHENRITATMTILTTNGSNLLEYRHTKDVFETTGLNLNPVWNKDKFAKYVTQGPAVCVKTLTDTFRVLASAVIGGGAVGGGGAGPRGAVGGVIQFGFGRQDLGIAGVGRDFLRFVFPPAPRRQPQGGPVNPFNLGFFGPQRFFPISTRITDTPLTLGLPDNQFEVVDRTVVRVFECANPFIGNTPSGGAGGGGTMIQPAAGPRVIGQVVTGG